jgi:hypothetical protein
MWAEPTKEAIAEIRLRAPQGVVEIGAGDGHWGETLQRAGIPWVGYDRSPRGPLVALGDHLTAARHSALAMLAVWPPDGDEIQRWVAAYQGDTIMICADHRRLHFGPSLDGWRQVSSVGIPAGIKGASELKTFGAPGWI